MVEEGDPIDGKQQQKGSKYRQMKEDEMIIQRTGLLTHSCFRLWLLQRKVPLTFCTPYKSLASPAATGKTRKKKLKKIGLSASRRKWA